MQRLQGRLAAVYTATCCVLLTSSVAKADERTDARREFRAGMQEVADGKYDAGIEHLERAYDILPHPNVLYNIGLAHMYAGRAEEALEYFERYRETAPPADAVEVDSLIRSLAQAEPGSTDMAVRDGRNLQSGAELGTRETLVVVEAAAREVRRLADEQNNVALRKQADELDRAVAKLRERQSGQTSAVEAPETPPSATRTPASPAQVGAQHPPPAPKQGDAREGVYEEEVVSASRFAQSPLDAPNATAIITAQDIRMSGVVQLSQVLRRVAGVEINTVTPNHSEVSIRGLNRRTSNKVLLLWDGRQIRKDFIGSNWIDNIPILVEDIERIEIIRGPASALYGADAFSGVINVITRAPGEGGSVAVMRGGNASLYNGGASFSGRSGAMAYRGSAGYLTMNNSVRVVGPNRVDIRPFNGDPNRSLNSVFANADVNYPYAKRGALSVGGNAGYGEFTSQGLSRLGQVVTDDAYETQVYGTLTTPIGIRFSTNYDHIVAHPRPAFVAPDTVSETAFRHTLSQDQLDVDLAWSDRFKALLPQNLTLGVSYRYKYIDWGWFDAPHTQHHIGAYLQDIIELAKPLRLQIGARVDRHPLLNNIQFSPRGSLVYRFLADQSIRVSGGRAFRSPSFLESYLRLQNEVPIRGVTAFGIGNDSLDPESITSVELGYQNQASDYFALEANVYYNWIKDAILFTAVDAFTLSDWAGGDSRAQYYQDIEAFPVSSLGFANERATYRQIGGELGVRFYPVEGLDIYANYSVHDTSPTDGRQVEEARANEQQTSLHKVNSGIQYRSAFGLELSIDVAWFSDQLWIEQVVDVASGIRWQEYPQPSFVMLSARIGYRLLRDRLELGVAGTNLALEDKRQHPLGQPIDTRVLGTVRVWF